MGGRNEMKLKARRLKAGEIPRMGVDSVFEDVPTGESTHQAHSFVYSGRSGTLERMTLRDAAFRIIKLTEATKLEIKYEK